MRLSKTAAKAIQQWLRVCNFDGHSGSVAALTYSREPYASGSSYFMNEHCLTVQADKSVILVAD